MAKNFFKSIFNQTKNSISKKKSLIDSQKLSDIIIINNNESNYFQQKPDDKFNLLSNYYPKKEKKNKKGNNFLDRINELNNKFHMTQDKYTLVKSSFDKLNDDLFSNLLKQIDCYIEEIQRLNQKLVIINNNNKEDVIKKLNKKILENEKIIRNYKYKIDENAHKEEKLIKEIEYYKKRIIFYKNKININLISRKISCENDDNEERKEKNDINSTIKIDNNKTKPRFNKIKNNYFNQSTRGLLKMRSSRKILSSTYFPTTSGNKYQREREKLFPKESLALEKNTVSEFLTDKISKEDSNTNLIHVQNNTFDKLNSSNDSSDNINERNNIDDSDILENLNIDENIKKLYSKRLNKANNNSNYSGYYKIKSEILSTSNFNINENEEILDNNDKINEYKNKENKNNLNDSHISKNNFKNRKKANISLDIKSNLSFNFQNNNNNKSISESNNTKTISSFKNPKDMPNKTFNKYKTFYGKFNQKSDKINKENSIQNKTKLKDNINKSKIIKEKNVSKSKTLEIKRLKTEKNINNKDNNISNKKKIKSKSIKKETKSINNNDNNKKKEVDEKEMKKILKDINEDYDNDIEMLNNQENQIKFLLNLIDVNN